MITPREYTGRANWRRILCIITKLNRKRPAPPGRHWAACAMWPDGDRKCIYLAQNARASA